VKKLLVSLLFAAVVAPAFADDALVLPQDVWRFRVIPSATIVNQTFDDDGERQDIAIYDSASIYNLSFALEYGVNDWINAALQWTPGWRIASVFDSPVNVPGSELQAAGVPPSFIPDNDELESSGLNDLFIGAKVQIIGEDAPVSTQDHRLAAAAGMILPLSTYDAKGESEDYIDEKPYQLRRVDEDLLAFGARLYYDFVVTENFFVNLYNESIFFVPRELDQFGVTFNQNTGQMETDVNTVEYDFGYNLTFELEPQYSTMIADGLELGAGLPITFFTAPESEIDGTGQDNERYTLSVGPSVNLFLQNAPWPIDLQLSYQTPLFGKNSDVTHSVVLQVKNYLQLW
jgi:hypothetical protein